VPWSSVASTLPPTGIALPSSSMDTLKRKAPGETSEAASSETLQPSSSAQTRSAQEVTYSRSTLFSAVIDSSASSGHSSNLRDDAVCFASQTSDQKAQIAPDAELKARVCSVAMQQRGAPCRQGTSAVDDTRRLVHMAVRSVGTLVIKNFES